MRTRGPKVSIAAELDRWRALIALPDARKGAVAARIGQRLIVTTGSPTSTDPSATTFVGCCLDSY